MTREPLSPEQAQEIMRRAAAGLLMPAKWTPGLVQPKPKPPSRTTTAEFVERYAASHAAVWNLWVTLTFAQRISEEEAESRLWDWLKDVARTLVKDHVPVAWAVERGTYGGLVHLHVLLALPRRTDMSGPLRAWKTANGGLNYEAVRTQGDVCVKINYMAKTPDWYLGVACPHLARCRRIGHCEKDSVRR